MPPALAALGLQLTRTGLTTSERTEREGSQRRLYGAADDPGDPSRMVHVDYGAPAQAGPLPCEHTEGAEPFDIADGTGWTCIDGSAPAAGWVIDGSVASMVAGTDVTRDQLIELARSLKPVTGDSDASPELEPSPLPAEWVTLVDEDVPYAQRVTETAWVPTASGGDDGDAQMLWVKTWTGVDDDQKALYAINAPINSQRTTVRGHPGYLYVSSQQGENGPLQIQLSWIESPGLVVTMTTDEAAPRGVVGIEVILGASRRG